MTVDVFRAETAISETLSDGLLAVAEYLPRFVGSSNVWDQYSSRCDQLLRQ